MQNGGHLSRHSEMVNRASLDADWQNAPRCVCGFKSRRSLYRCGSYKIINKFGLADIRELCAWKRGLIRAAILELFLY